jgi:hypothetical protein
MYMNGVLLLYYTHDVTGYSIIHTQYCHIRPIRAGTSQYKLVRSTTYEFSRDPAEISFSSLQLHIRWAKSAQ